MAAEVRIVIVTGREVEAEITTGTENVMDEVTAIIGIVDNCFATFVATGSLPHIFDPCVLLWVQFTILSRERDIDDLHSHNAAFFYEMASCD